MITEFAIRCSCGGRAVWVQQNRYICPDCMSLLAEGRYPTWSRCPYCLQPTTNQDVLGDWLWYDIYGKGQKRVFHTPCLEKYQKELADQRRELDEEIARLDVLAELPCPHCGEVGISQFPDHYAEDGTIIGVYCCNNCDAELETEWVNELLSKLSLPSQ